MSLSDPIADMLTRIRNAQSQRLAYTHSPYSKLRENLLQVLLSEGYIAGYEVLAADSVKAQLHIELKYVNTKPVIKKIIRVSKPGRRVYSASRKMAKFYNGLGCTILTTSQGVMTDYEAKQKNVGGEVLCNIF